MAIRDIFRVSKKTFYNPRAWLGYDALKDQTKTIYSIVKDVAEPAKPQRTESFQEAMKRLNVSEKEAKNILEYYWQYALIFFVFGILDLIYGFYLLLYHRTFFGFVLAFSVMILLFGQSFKYHFWYFQIKKRKLGCTLQEWKEYTFGRGKK